MARKRDLARLAASAWSRASASARSLSVRSVTSRPTLCISAGRPASLRTKPSRQAIQRGPSAVCDLLVVHARAVRFQRGVALFEHGQHAVAADQFFARRCRELAIGVVGKGDAAFGVAQHDQVALRFEQAAGALPRLPAIPSSGRPALRCAWRSCASSCASGAAGSSGWRAQGTRSRTGKLAPIAKAWGS